VERLSGLDAGFLAMETDRMHMHVSAVMVFEPPESSIADTPAAHFDRLHQVVEERLHLVPLMRRRVVRVPFGLHHPMWVEDPHFDLDFHLRRASLPAPGGPRELAEFVADLSGRALDLNRPLWEMHMVEGLESGHIAVVSKMHHAAMDGAAGADTVATFLDLGPEPRLVTPPPRPWRSEPVPSEAELIASALTSLTRQPEKVAGTARNTFDALRSLAERNRRMREEDDVNPPPALFSAPRTSLNGVISPQRRFAFLQGQLDELRTVKQTFGGTINDVVLAAVAGALRRLMAERGEDLDESLVAMVPISLRTEEDRGTHGNKLSAMLVSLATAVADPVERLAVVARSSRLAKGQSGVLSGDLMQRWAQMALPAFSSRVARVAGNLRLFDHIRPLFNVVVSNVPGPEIPLWCAGGRLVALYPVGPIIDGVGLNITVFSYLGSMYFGILGCRELVPEVDHLAELLADSLAELVKAALRTGSHWA
jgi:diacylglycerol O-acyltransferase / wax synthase